MTAKPRTGRVTALVNATAAALLLTTAPPARSAVIAVPPDRVVVANGFKLACEGPASSALAQAQAYPVRVEFVGAQGQAVRGMVVKVTDTRDRSLLEVSCVGPHMLIDLPRGAVYTIEGRVAGSSAKPQRALVRSPATGQRRTVLKFPDA